MVFTPKSPSNLEASASSGPATIGGDTNGYNIANHFGMQPLQTGKYTVVGIDIDTTGRRLIDEIVQLAAYTPNDHFEQYIMPYMNLNPAARQRHQIRVISIGFYRMLKSMQTYKILKSKSEIAAFGDFLNWLEDVKAKDKDSQGLILVYHEERKFIPYMILESLKKYNLLDRFSATVKSFANGLNLAKTTLMNDNVQQLSLRRMTRVLNQVQISVLQDGAIPSGAVLVNDLHSIGSQSSAVGDGSTMQQQQNSMVSSTSMTPGGDNNSNIIHMNRSRKTSRSNDNADMFDGNASVRARLAFEVVFKLSLREQREPIEAQAAYEKMLQALRVFAYPIECDLSELEAQNKNLERQNSFRPIFLNYFKTTLYHRVRAVKFRIILAENGYDLNSLGAVWNEKGKDGIIDALQAVKELKTDDRAELVELLDSFYDPSKTTIKPIVRSNNRRRNNRRVRGGNMVKGNNNNNIGNVGSQPSNMEQGAGGDKQNVAASGVSTTEQLPDSTTNTATNKSANHGQRNSSNNNNNMNSVSGPKPQRRRPRRNNLRNHPQRMASATTSGGVNQTQANINIPIAASN